MTETNHAQTIPISPNVFPTKNKKMTEQPKPKKWSETRNRELTLEELFQLIGDVEWNLKDYIWDLKQEVEELKSQVETLHYKLGTYD